MYICRYMMNENFHYFAKVFCVDIGRHLYFREFLSRLLRVSFKLNTYLLKQSFYLGLCNENVFIYSPIIF